MHSKFLLPILLSGLLIAGCNALQVQQLTELANKEQQDAFLQTAVTKNEAAASNVSMDGSVTSEMETDKTVTFQFSADIVAEDSTVQMSVGEVKIYSVDRGGRSFVGNGTTWVELADTGTDDNDQLLSTEEYFGYSEVLDQPYTYKGIQACGNDKCHVFEFVEDGDQSLVYFDGNNLVKQVEMTGDENAAGKFEVSYGNAQLMDAPTNAQKVEGLEGLGALLEIYAPLFEAAGVDMTQ